MERINELTNYANVTASKKDVELTEEQIISLRIAGTDKLKLVLMSGDKKFVEITDIDLNIAKDIKIAVNKNNLAINIPIDAADDGDDFDDNYNEED